MYFRSFDIVQTKFGTIASNSWSFVFDYIGLQLLEQNHDQTNQISAYNETKYQLKVLTEKFNTQTKLLDDTKLNVDALTKEKQLLLEQIELDKQKHKQVCLQIICISPGGRYKKLKYIFIGQVFPHKG